MVVATEPLLDIPPEMRDSRGESLMTRNIDRLFSGNVLERALARAWLENHASPETIVRISEKALERKTLKGDLRLEIHGLLRTLSLKHIEGFGTRSNSDLAKVTTALTLTAPVARVSLRRLSSGN